MRHSHLADVGGTKQATPAGSACKIPSIHAAPQPLTVRCRCPCTGSSRRAWRVQVLAILARPTNAIPASANSGTSSVAMDASWRSAIKCGFMTRLALAYAKGLPVTVYCSHTPSTIAMPWISGKWIGIWRRKSGIPGMPRMDWIMPHGERQATVHDHHRADPTARSNGGDHGWLCQRGSGHANWCRFGRHCPRPPRSP